MLEMILARLAMWAAYIGAGTASSWNNYQPTEPENIKNRSFDIVTARAVSNLSILLELCIPLVKEGGYFVGYKGSNYQEELNTARNALKVLNCKLVDVYEYDLEEYGRHSLIKILKEKATNKIYPRPYAQIKKKPL